MDTPSPPAAPVPHCFAHQCQRLLPLIAPAPWFGSLLLLSIPLKTKIRAQPQTHTDGNTGWKIVTDGEAEESQKCTARGAAAS